MAADKEKNETSPAEEEVKEEAAPEEAVESEKEKKKEDKKAKKEKKEEPKPQEPDYKAELNGANDRYLRLLAEYDNYRKRSQKEKDSLYGTTIWRARSRRAPRMRPTARAWR